MNQTRVFEIDGAQAARLEAALRAGLPRDADWRPVGHARFSVKTDALVVTCYRSGKLVIQGRDVDAFVARFLPGVEPRAGPAAAHGLVFDAPTIGSDEAGKGDFFGPLVVAAVYAEPARGAELLAMGVADSKTLGDARMYPIAERIERTFDCEVRALEPPDYNARHRSDPNVNRILADLHAEAIAALHARHRSAHAVVDQFAAEDLVASRLRKLGAAPTRLIQVPRAEAHPVVAAASIVARVRFLEGLRRCEEEAGTDLHKGAGPPVDQAARRVVQVGGMELLGKVAKLHFRNAQKLGDRRP